MVDPGNEFYSVLNQCGRTLALIMLCKIYFYHLPLTLCNTLRRFYRSVTEETEVDGDITPAYLDLCLSSNLSEILSTS